ncbi:hypothetical protein CKN73_02870 [Carnobacterium divergens]|uniref:FadR/GntR family transcriptional regulator n=1 Tax=Carnobacterium divergens TaxID=2748 RepID=UPI0010723851|nr:FadR/GntR family transcriptional regulator [Carnobacterium divergens]TFJ43597.1 hypothetical protein CKN77_02800 [Carnobacterium divergens]TFJ51427.1 hypothetical protein CKN73_02870 [Carnobacterium divergens]TFJ56417.1 hypothetical protein CKN83_02815 [Carnobacterium divergens]TFJ64057.1 hypothetical protein CKN89_02895 [Carnobacterium divergens]TFJ73376.1 hypothetical protein CKN91_02815 [Carnobacterium divergens]
MKKPTRISLAKQITTEIESQIESGRWPVGSKIPPESHLAEQFGVSRNTMREALQSLTQLGVLASKPGDGTYVMTAGKFEANMYTRLEKAETKEIAEARLFLEKDLAILAAKNRNETDIEKIALALKKRNEKKATLEEEAKSDIEFHVEIAKAAHNSVMYELYCYMSNYIYELILEKMYQDLEQDLPDLEKLHQDLFLAIKKQDPIEAEKVASCINHF